MARTKQCRKDSKRHAEADAEHQHMSKKPRSGSQAQATEHEDNLPQRPSRVGPLGSTPPSRSPGNSSNYSKSAENYDVLPGIEPEGRASLGDPHRWRKDKEYDAEFINSPSGIGSTWIGRRPLGKGGFGIAGLWEKYDQDGRLQDVKLWY